MDSSGSTAGLADLLADGPDQETADALSLFGQFVGTWDVTVRFFDPDGAPSFEGLGVWQFAWVLDGRAVQDTLTYGQPGVPTSSSRRIGTTLRSYHPSTGEWHQVWVSPAAELFLVMQARATDDGILVTGTDMDGSRLRWTFTEITPDSFTWTGRTDGCTGDWRVEQLMSATRR